MNLNIRVTKAGKPAIALLLAACTAQVPTGTATPTSGTTSAPTSAPTPRATQSPSPSPKPATPEPGLALTGKISTRLLHRQR